MSHILIKDYTNEFGRVIPKGSEMTFDADKLAQMANDGYINLTKKPSKKENAVSKKELEMRSDEGKVK
jgi:hypothetical protein